MVEKFIEERARRTKRLKRLPALEPKDIPLVPKGGKGNSYRYTKTGYRADIDIVARSGWEANIARVLEVHGINWEFEPEVFTYPVKRGTKGYTPDFYLPDTKEWIEVKGWFDKKSQIKIKRFKIYYPDDFSRLTLIISRSSKAARDFCSGMGVPIVLYYEDFRDSYKDRISNWEGS